MDSSWRFCKTNLASLEKSVDSHPDQLHLVKPSGASIASVCIFDTKTGQPLDDVSYCETLLEETGLLLVPGGKTFGTEGADDFKGYIRVVLSVAPEDFERALGLWGEYLDRSKGDV